MMKMKKKKKKKMMMIMNNPDKNEILVPWFCEVEISNFGKEVRKIIS